MAESKGGVSKAIRVTLVSVILVLVVLLVAALNEIRELAKKAETVAGAVTLNPAALMQLSVDIAVAFNPSITGTPTMAPQCELTGAPTTSSTPPTDNGADLDQAVEENARTNREAIVAEMASYLETTWNNDAAGGGAVGYWQIQHPGPGGLHQDITYEQAKTPSYAAWYMFNKISPNFRDGIRNVNPSLWVSNPELAAETAIYNTEQPGAWYHDSQGQARVDEAFQKSLAKLPAMGYSPLLAKETLRGGGSVNLPSTSPTDGTTETRNQQVAQHLFVGVSDVATARAIVTKYNIGGLFLESEGSPARVNSDLLNALPSLAASAYSPMLIATDQEYTSTVNALGLANDKKASDLAKMSDGQVRQEGVRIGRAMASQGFNMDFAPVVDEQVASNPVIGKYNRGISAKPSIIANKAAAFMNGLFSQGVTPVLKHFPGDGNTNGDPHDGLVTTPPLQELEKSDMKPFVSLMNKQTAVMVGNIVVPYLSGKLPASQSVATYLYMRNTLGFNGLTITDELSMQGAGSESLDTKVVNALNAGADMALFNVKDFSQFEEIFNVVSANIASSDDSRILGQKSSFGLPTLETIQLQNCKATTKAEASQALAGQVLTTDRNVVITSAMKWVGTPYSWAGGGLDGPSTGWCENGAAYNDCNIVGFDCSGLTEYADGQIGVDIGGDSATQYENTKAFGDLNHDGKLNAADLKYAQPGDLLFFRGSDPHPNGVGHVGIYLGGDKMLNAPQSGELVQITTLTQSRMADFVAVTDPFAAKAANALPIVPIG